MGVAGLKAGRSPVGRRAPRDRSSLAEAGEGAGVLLPTSPDRLSEASLAPLVDREEIHSELHLQHAGLARPRVPDDSSDFLEFVNYVLALRVDGEPVLFTAGTVAC